MRRQISIELGLPVFARRAGLSERHVSRLFQCELGVTFREHVAALRLERAKALLRETGMSVIEVDSVPGMCCRAMSVISPSTSSRVRSANTTRLRERRSSSTRSVCQEAGRLQGRLCTE